MKRELNCKPGSRSGAKTLTTAGRWARDLLLFLAVSIENIIISTAKIHIKAISERLNLWSWSETAYEQQQFSLTSLIH